MNKWTPQCMHYCNDQFSKERVKSSKNIIISMLMTLSIVLTW